MKIIIRFSFLPFPPRQRENLSKAYRSTEFLPPLSRDEVVSPFSLLLFKNGKNQTTPSSLSREVNGLLSFLLLGESPPLLSLYPLSLMKR